MFRFSMDFSGDETLKSLSNLKKLFTADLFLPAATQISNHWLKAFVFFDLKQLRFPLES